MTVLHQVCETCGRYVLETGVKYAIEAALDREGSPAAGEYLDSLSRGRGKGRDLVADMLIRMEQFARTGELIVPKQLNHLRAELWELKAGTLRLPFYYRRGAACGQVRLTHGFTKRGEKTPIREIDRGLAIMREDSKR